MSSDKDNVLRISRPRIVECGDHTRLEADAAYTAWGERREKTIFFEVERRWGQHFVDGLSDAFVLALLEVALESGLDIRHETPMSEDLRYQLETYLVPVLSRKVEGIHHIRFDGPTTAERPKSEGVAGTGFSAGVDSFYSALVHKDIPYASKRVTHLLLAVNGAAMTGISEEMDRRWFEEEMGRFAGLAGEMGMELVGCNSNVSLLNEDRRINKGGDAITTASFVHALRGLFGTYYWASAYEADVLEFRMDDAGYMEPFTVPLLGVDGLRFYHSGCEVSRVEKVERIADTPTAQRGLTVCGHPESCGVCNKCTRTMAELYAVGRLDSFLGVFPMARGYERRVGRELGRELAQDHAPFTTEIVDMMRRRGLRVPLSAYAWEWLRWRPQAFLKRSLRYNTLAIRLYYGSKLPELLGERRPPAEEVEARMSGVRFEK